MLSSPIISHLHVGGRAGQAGRPAMNQDTARGEWGPSGVVSLFHTVAAEYRGWNWLAARSKVAGARNRTSSKNKHRDVLTKAFRNIINLLTHQGGPHRYYFSWRLVAKFH